MIPYLPPTPVGCFPDPAEALAQPNGLLAAGGELSVPWLLAAYRRGIFPWFTDEEPVLWWSPAPRCVLFVDRLHLSRRFRRKLRARPLRWTMDRCFERVVERCAQPRGPGDGTWITPSMRRAYAGMHRAGHAHSVEIWDRDLVGGLYGVSIGRMFFAESMFSARTEGSKYALHRLVTKLGAGGFQVIDCQVTSPHLQRMGAEEISRARFEAMLADLNARPAPPADWWASGD